MIASLPYRAPDSTQLLNFITKDILPKGVYVFPNPFIVPGVSPFQVRVKLGWVARNYDGMTIREEDSDITVTIGTVADYYIVLESQYVLSPEPNMQVMAILVSAYEALTTTQQNALVIFGKVTPPAGGTITTSNIDVDNFIERPRGVLALDVDLQNQNESVVRAVSSNAGLASLSEPINNEVAYVSNEKSLYIYSTTTSSWSAINKFFSGSSTFAGSASARTITFSAGVLPTAYSVSITPTADSAGSLGSFWVVKSTNSFTVYNDGSWTGAGATFDYVVFPV